MFAPLSEKDQYDGQAVQIASLELVVSVYRHGGKDWAWLTFPLEVADRLIPESDYQLLLKNARDQIDERIKSGKW
jgi:hypothetical protein